MLRTANSSSFFPHFFCCFGYFLRKVIAVSEVIRIFATENHIKASHSMPEIARFYGIIIKMFFKPKEHDPAHIHALYNEFVGVFDIHTYEMTEGDMPLRAQQLVKEWLAVHKDELLEMWQTQHIVKLPPL